ncbi:MAG TPA: carboxypeptidase-like regulatory domain-containing protein [Candidatus Polarisedimenticolia bacterium]|nr:carboxypeptidase-like regulatory domain-containing protein [Candidatus Polarisedimenticolia bacterium]
MELNRSIWNHGFAKRTTSQTLRCLLLVLALAVVAPAQRDKLEDPTAVLNFFVIKDDNGKPVRSAAVIMHPVSAGGKQSRGGLELKTDADGKASFDGIPYGKLRVQVLATGFQTFGEDYDVDRAKLSFTIKLKRPQGQYSIYQDHPEEKRDDKTPPPDPNAKPQ